MSSGAVSMRGAGGTVRGFCRRRPGIHQRFRRDRQVSGSGRLPLRQLAGADDAFIERVGAARDRGVLDDRIDQAGRAADDAEIVDPLGARIELRLLAVGHRLAGDHHHRDPGDKGAVHAHGALQQAGARMQQHALHLAGGQRVARRDVDGERFVPHVQQFGTSFCRWIWSAMASQTGAHSVPGEDKMYSTPSLWNASTMALPPSN